MFRLSARQLVRDPVPDETKSFYTWFSGQVYRTGVSPPGGYPGIKLHPMYGKRWGSARTLMAFSSGWMMYSFWHRPEKTRWDLEMETEHNERNAAHLPYQTSEINLRMLVSAYKRLRYEQDNFLDKGYIGMTSEFRKFFYHDDVWRPDFHDIFRHPYIKWGGPGFSYNWALSYW